MIIPFLKMHGCGNDFVVLDNRKGDMPALNWKRLADRHFGIGCDQVVVLETPTRTLPLQGEGRVEADIFMRLFNADGGEVESCGNASRCVAWVLSQESGIRNQKISIDTLAGMVKAQVRDEQHITIDMGEPRLEWDRIPLVQAMDTLHLPIEKGTLRDPVAVSMGNPHMVFFVDNVDAVLLHELGPELERHALFPARANVNVASVENAETLRLRVWERGAGLTLACGTGACATLVAAVRRGLCARKAEVILPGGSLQIEWRESDNHVLMTGPVATSFEGAFAGDRFLCTISEGEL